MTRPRVLLFDIDGTLVRTGGAGKAAMEAGLRAAFGVPEVVPGIPYGGRTDHDIGRELLTAHGLAPTAANVSALHEAYLTHLPGALAAAPGGVCPGVADLLPRLTAAPGVALGLLTGNARLGAMRKLSYFGLWGYFPFGGFGDDHPDRDDVARAALAEAERHLGQSVRPSDVWVIGDTPLDVRCGRAIGATVIAVATGWHPAAELAAAGPDLLLDHLADAAALPGEWFDP